MGGPVVIEGTWEEVALHAAELAGRRVRLTVLSEAHERESDAAVIEPERSRIRLPDPIILTDECSASFDLYRPATGELVIAREGGERLPSIVLEQSSQGGEG